MIKGYRIVEIKDGKVMSLFHGTSGSRSIPLDTWNKADIKMVCDGSRSTATDYLSGWHFMQTREEADNLLNQRFRIHTNRHVIPCYIRGNIRMKRAPGKGIGAYLADEIMIRSEDIPK